jgi:hypothetical protein
VTITPGLAAELALLTQALDLPDTNVADTLTRLTADAQAAVDSYLGLSVAITASQSRFGFTVLDEGVRPEHIRTSLLIPLTPAADENTATASVALILYAGTPGAFVDLAADLAWITGRASADFLLDEHRALASHNADPATLTAKSIINQAIGVLIGRGATPEEAERDLHERAVKAGIDPLAAATLILAALTPPGPEAA